MTQQPTIIRGSDLLSATTKRDLPEELALAAVTPGWKRCRINPLYEMTATEPYRFRRFIENDRLTIKPIESRTDASQSMSEKDGYTRVTIGNMGGRTVHSLIFLEMDPKACADGTTYEWMSDNHMCVDHINGRKSDNRLENLQMITNSENQNRRVRGEQEVVGSDTYIRNLAGSNVTITKDVRGRDSMIILPEVLAQKYSRHRDHSKMPEEISARVFTRNDDPRDILYQTGRQMAGDECVGVYVRQIPYNLSRRQVCMSLENRQHQRTLISLVSGNEVCRKMVGDMILDTLRNHLGPHLRYISEKEATTLCNNVFRERHPDIFFHMSSEDLCRMTDGELSITNKRLLFVREMERDVTERATRDVIPCLGKKREAAIKTLGEYVRDVYGYRAHAKYVSTIVNRHIPDMTTDLMDVLTRYEQK